jgi:formate hydrogenlyase subunit 6/NADH:ubiquinone oxidoreductase subunit I
MGVANWMGAFRMKLTTMLRDIWKAFWDKPATEQYPAEKLEVADRFRGKLQWNPQACTGCTLCVQDCPAKAIEIIALDKKAKRFVMRYHADQCIYCGQCVESCRFEAIRLVNGEWELGTSNLIDFDIAYGNEADIEEALASKAQQLLEESEN